LIKQTRNFKDFAREKKNRRMSFIRGGMNLLALSERLPSGGFY
jgi:hypothetical protein